MTVTVPAPAAGGVGPQPPYRLSFPPGTPRSAYATYGDWTTPGAGGAYREVRRQADGFTGVVG
jgi:hypothetical protein